MRVAETSAEATIPGANFVPTMGGDTAEIEVGGLEERLYVDIDPNVVLHFNASSHNLDFITDDSSQVTTIPDLAVVDQYTLYGYNYNSTNGGVKTVENTLTFDADHNLSHGDYVIYDSNGYPAIGGMVTGKTYYVEVVDTKTVRLYYTYGMHISETVDITFTPMVIIRVINNKHRY